jgi:Zn-dependent metalloprotease
MHLCRNPLCCCIPPYIAEQLGLSESFYYNATLKSDATPDTNSLRFISAGDSEKRRKYREIYTYDQKNSPGYPMKLVRKESEPPTEDETVNEAYNHSGDVYDFYEQVFNRNSLNGEGSRLISVVNILPELFDTAGLLRTGKDYAAMGYAKGDGSKYFSFTKSLDVVGHEMTHGLIEFTSKLKYQSESGALNESFCDVMGSLVTQWKNKQTAKEADWLIGKEIYFPETGIKAIRTLKEEKVHKEDKQAKHYQDLYTDGTELNKQVHINSGIPNHAFYKVAMEIGGNAWEKPGQIWYKTLLVLNPNSTMKDVANQTYIQAGCLFGKNSLEQKAVKKAWDEVGLSFD